MLSLNYINCLTESVGPAHGMTEAELLGIEPRLKAAHQSLMGQADAGQLGFMDLPNHIAEAKKMMSWARKARAPFDTLVVLGIGGSALGGIAVQQAIHPTYWNMG